MAGEATIGALRVVLGADTAKFEDNLRSALGSLADFGKKALSIATGIQLANIFEQTFHGVVDSINGAIDAADKLSKASQKFGVPVDTLAALSNAARLERCQRRGTRRFTIEARRKPRSPRHKSQARRRSHSKRSASASRTRAVNVKDFDVLFGQIADKFSSFRDGMTKNELATTLFGRAGADMIPILNQGSKGIEDMKNRLKELQPNIDADSLAAEKYKDNLKLLLQAKDAIVLRILGSSGMLAAMDQLTKSFVDSAQDGAKFADVGDQIGKAIQYAVVWVDALTFSLNALTLPFRAIVAAFYNLAQGDFAGAWKAIADRVQGTKDSFDNAAAAVEKLAKGAIDFTYVGLSDELIKATIAATQLANAPQFDPEAAKKLKQVNDEIKKLHDQALDASGVFAGQLAPGFLAATANLDALKGQITLTGDGLVKLGPLAAQFNQAMLNVEGQKAIFDALPLWDQLQAKVTAVTLALQATGDQGPKTAAALQKAALDANAAMASQLSSYTGFLAQGAAAAASTNKEFAASAKALAIIQATINTYEAATKAFTLFGGWPLGAAAAAATIAAGLGLVAKISAQNFATGGSFKVPGGISGTDSKMIPLHLSPGERVDVTPSSQVRDSRGGREIVLNGIGPRDLFTGTMLRDLVDALNQGQRDGYRLKLAEG